MSVQEDPVQREIHQDWANREYIEVITSSIKKIADFLNSFGEGGRGAVGRLGRAGRAPAVSHCRLPADMSCRSRLATLNEKLTALERRIEYIEARVSSGVRAGGPGRAPAGPELGPGSGSAPALAPAETFPLPGRSPRARR